MELKTLSTFVTVARLKNFSAAARELHTVQPTVSRHISELENELQTKLFARTTHQVELTPQGERLLPEALNILANDLRVKTLIKSRENEEKQEIRIGYLATACAFFLPDLIQGFRRQHQDVHFKLHEMTPAELTEAMVDDKVDVILSRECPHLDSDYFTLHQVYSDRLVAVLPSNHRLADHAQIDINELECEELHLFHRNEWLGVYEKVIRSCRDYGFTPNVIGNPMNMRHLATTVSSGLGLSIAPQCIKFILDMKSVCVPIEQLNIHLPLNVYFRRQNKHDVINQFVEHLVKSSAVIQAQLDSFEPKSDGIDSSICTIQ